jgi:ribulose-phosphate 3-epimerase
MIIIPTILEKDPIMAEERWGDIKSKTRWVSLDVIDGVFSYGRTFDLEQVRKIFPDDNKLVEVHLMVKEPIGWINKTIEAGASRIIGQVEMMSDKSSFVAKAKEEGLEAGLGWDIETEFDPKEVPPETDVVLFMARKSGFEPQPVDDKVWIKIKAAKKAGFRVGVDGGINKKIADKLEEEGVDIAYVGSNYLNIVNEKTKRN